MTDMDARAHIARVLLEEARSTVDRALDILEPQDEPLPRHLDPDALPIAECDVCHRLTWAPSVDYGASCKMEQPNGSECPGKLQKFVYQGQVPEPSHRMVEPRR